MNQSLLVFWQLLKRDAYVSHKQIRKLIVNCCILLPCFYIFTYAYLQANLFFGVRNDLVGTSILVGTVLLVFLILSYNLIISLIFDIEGDRFINYQIGLLSPRLVLLERILFASLLTFLLISPFYPVGKILLGDYFMTTHTSWARVFIMLFLSSFLVCSYHMFITCSLKNSRQIARVWSRCNDPLLIFGGYWIPWHVMNKFSPVLGYITLANPFIYITEGLRQSFLRQADFFEFSTCVIGLIIWTGLFIYGSMYHFKKRMDHI